MGGMTHRFSGLKLMEPDRQQHSGIERKTIMKAPQRTLFGTFLEELFDFFGGCDQDWCQPKQTGLYDPGFFQQPNGTIMKNMYKILFTVAVAVIFSGSAYGQNVLQGGHMESEDYWNVSHINADAQVTYEFGYDEVTPAHGEGGALMLSGSVSGNPGDQLTNFVVYQLVTLQGGQTYLFDGAFKDVDGVDQFWAEVYIESVPPEVGEDWGGDQFAGFNTWGGCGNGVDGTFLADGCEGDGDNLFTVDGEGEQTFYFGIKVGAGSWDAGTTRSFKVLIDEVSLVDIDATSTKLEDRPHGFALEQNYPNPFNPVTTIRFTLPETSHVSLEIFSITGERVAVALNETRAAGSHSINFDASRLTSGLYFYRLQSGSFDQTKKMQLIK